MIALRQIDMSDLLTPAEAAEKLRLSERTLRDLKRHGLIRYVALAKRKIAYRPEDCEEYISSRVRRDEPCDTRPVPKRALRTRPGTVVPFSKLV